MDEMRLTEMDSCDGKDIGSLESSSYFDVSYPIFEGFSLVVFHPEG